MLAIVIAIAAYWGVRVLTPQPTAAPPPVAAPVPREPDPVLAARMFGLVEQAATRTVSNIQVAGLFGAGEASSAVLVVDGKPPRAYVLGQEVAPGIRLVAVTQDLAVVESAGGRQELRAPPRPTPTLATGAPAPAYVLERNMLSAAPGSGGSAAPGALPMSQPMFQPGMQPGMQPPPPLPQPGMQPGVPLRQVPQPGVPPDAMVPPQQQPQVPAPGLPER